ncbi:PIN domain-containing protein [Achromobacter xylosoxidans]|uniref:PIN domain-containing protein n=1 Tax=Alcaligenes xylosoxydans xylosoxydans TaxID=85698 RepID=UPI00192B630A|nr:PIN domain-containing protein [Achromobacter xylosoxidans]
MSLPTAVFLDTSVLAGQQYNFSSAALTTFIPLAKKHDLKLLLPEATESEVVRQIRERSQEALKALEDARRRAPFLSKWKHFPPKQTSYMTDWEVMRIAKTEWEEFLKNFNLIKLDYSTVNLKAVMHWYDHITPPFREGKKRKEFPDAFAIAILEAHARKTGNTIAVVSEDSDMKLACDRFSSLLYFKSLPTLTELLLSDSKKLDKIRESLLNDLSTIEKAATEAADELDYYHSDRGYKVKRTKLHGVSVDDVRVVGIGAGECTITFDGELEAEHLLEWNEWDHYGDDYHEEEAWVIESSPLSGTAKVTLDPKTGAISDVSYFDLETGDIEINENPKRRW